MAYRKFKLAQSMMKSFAGGSDSCQPPQLSPNVLQAFSDQVRRRKVTQIHQCDYRMVPKFVVSVINVLPSEINRSIICNESPEATENRNILRVNKFVELLLCGWNKTNQLYCGTRCCLSELDVNICCFEFLTFKE
jgi:hypothetical protein